MIICRFLHATMITLRFSRTLNYSENELRFHCELKRGITKQELVRTNGINCSHKLLLRDLRLRWQ